MCLVTGVIPGQAGDLYDLWTRPIATYLGKHIPGNPSVMAQNLPGAVTVIVANHVQRAQRLQRGNPNVGAY